MIISCMTFIFLWLICGVITGIFLYLNDKQRRTHYSFFDWVVHILAMLVAWQLFLGYYYGITDKSGITRKDKDYL